ncbi:MAG: hypothetical protein IBX48_00565 [Thiomicrospira sp.]|uniref:hypothetical protein n=1 Tax=Thiomicrospira sp. TaxID=935 RepID=UPI0019DCE126|nr:hypothetical protein [Thiomicrospira sp.]MBE0492811.1 hypothetical protein [Thiomicrospira sp.]
MIKRYLGLSGLVVGVLLTAGCATLGEGATALLEVPTVEASANRVAVGTGVLRVNHHILNNMPISADAKWPQAITDEMSDQDYKAIRQALANDPWYATRHYSDPYQMRVLGGYMAPGISPLTYEVYQKIQVLYGADAQNWPNVLKYSPRLDQFLEFVDAEDKTPIQIEAAQATMHPNLFAGLTSLMPVNYQKDLVDSHQQMQTAIDEAAYLKKDKAYLEKRLEDNKATNKPNYTGSLRPLSVSDVQQINEQIAVLDVQIKQAEQQADQKQEIHFLLLDSALVALKSDINLSEDRVMLAQNIKRVLDDIKSSAMQAGVLYSLSVASLIGRNSFQNFDKELVSLAVSTALVPVDKRDLMGERIVRLTENVIYLLPSIGMGSYYIVKQYSLANKYAKVVDVIIEADASQKKMQATK